MLIFLDAQGIYAASVGYLRTRGRGTPRILYPSSKGPLQSLQRYPHGKYYEPWSQSHTKKAKTIFTDRDLSIGLVLASLYYFTFLVALH